MFNRFFFCIRDGVIHNLLHGVICFFKVGNMVLCNSTINILASTGPNGESIAPPSICVYIPALQLK